MSQLRAVTQFLSVFNNEHQTTMNVLKALPEDRFEYRPHEKNMTLGALAFHTAYAPLGIAKAIAACDFSAYTPPAAPATKQELLDGAEAWHKEACDIIATFDEKTFAGAIPMPGGAFPNETFFWINLYHLIHHRGQLSVYLRLVGAKVPSIYGPSGDENPFAKS